MKTFAPQSALMQAQTPLSTVWAAQAAHCLAVMDLIRGRYFQSRLLHHLGGCKYTSISEVLSRFVQLAILAGCIQQHLNRMQGCLAMSNWTLVTSAVSSF
ncbi:unnamed protein product [Ostreobium quekettii]|uniref:Uncharacterized protein n=1 Tax=Ostreobium quekettii TaxID=121088 RepID=A0A8S1J8X4_9CHLO|nr:unnamed protein product [Ostreobium quekettii]